MDGVEQIEELEEEETEEIDNNSESQDFYARAFSTNKSFPCYSGLTHSMKQILPPGHSGPIIFPKINVYDSPILLVNNAAGVLIYILLDTGATTSLMRLDIAVKLNLKIIPTKHRVVQIDGELNLKVLGEVHTKFFRKGISVSFSGLVVNKMGTPVVGGTNFHVENDITSRMATNSISIGSSITVQSASPTAMKVEEIDRRQRQATVVNRAKVLPGEEIVLKLPSDYPSNCEVMIESNVDEVEPFFMPKIVEANFGVIAVTNDSNSVLDLKKNCKPVRVTMTDTEKKIHKVTEGNPRLNTPISTKTEAEIIKDISVDGAKNMTSKQKNKILSYVKENLDIFQPDLPGYNHHFGPVYANIEFNSKMRPVAHKLRAPAYNQHAVNLYNQKCLEMKMKGVLVDPQQIDVQPIVTNNAWLTSNIKAMERMYHKGCQTCCWF